MHGICRLCTSACALQQSHIVPGFVFRWMKRTGSKYFQRPISPNSRLQDGPKRFLLCPACEQAFSKLEKHFAETIFQPYIADNNTTCDYDHRLYLFLASLMWRTIEDHFQVLGKTSDKIKNADDLVRTGESLRISLTSQNNAETLPTIHLLLTSLIEHSNVSAPYLNTYLTRAVDTTIGSGDQHCFAYMKFARFIVIGAIWPLNDHLFRGTLIDPNGGRLSAPQGIDEEDVGRFIIDRARIAHAKYNESISSRQRSIINEQSPVNKLGEDLRLAVLADYRAGQEAGPTSWRRPPRNHPCPCGSGKKFKHCHGTNA